MDRLPQRLEARVATLVYAPDWGHHDGADPSSLVGDDLRRRYWSNPLLYPPERPLWNERWLRACEIPAINGVADARSIARLYGLLSGVAEDGGEPLLSARALALGASELSSGVDSVSRHPARFGVGFQLQGATRAFGPVDEAFGHSGMGGSMHGAWPRHRLGFSYCMNQMRDAEVVDARLVALTTAVAAVVGE